MAWINEIDATDPLDTDPAAEGAEQFRNLKAALEERLASRMPGWPATQPLPILSVDVGTLAARPATPAGNGHVYIVDDPLPKRYYYGKSGAWQELTFGSSAIADSVLVVADSDNGVTIPASTDHHVHTVPITGMTNAHQVIGWRYRWKCPDISSSFTNWSVTDHAVQIGNVPNEWNISPNLVRIGRFEIDFANKNIIWRFRNEDTDPHDVDLEWVVILLTV